MAGDAKVMRYDAGALRPPVRTPQGFLRIDGHVSRPGIYGYRNTRADEEAGLGRTGEMRYELRPEEEVFSPAAMAGFEGAPITADHPGVLVTSKNVKSLEVGSATSPGRRDGNLVAASMVVKDPKAIARVDSGELRELSPGYRIALEPKSGFDPRYATADNPKGRYDFVQRDIEINHLALVPRARGGSDLRVRMDGVDVPVSVEVRADDGMMDTEAGDEIDAPEVVALTTSVDGHQHTLDPSEDAGCTSAEYSTGADKPHAHKYVIDQSGKLLIADNAGHGHEVDPNAFGVVRSDAYNEDQPRDELGRFGEGTGGKGGFAGHGTHEKDHAKDAKTQPDASSSTGTSHAHHVATTMRESMKSLGHETSAVKEHPNGEYSFQHVQPAHYVDKRGKYIGSDAKSAATRGATKVPEKLVTRHFEKSGAMVVTDHSKAGFDHPGSPQKGDVVHEAQPWKAPGGRESYVHEGSSGDAAREAASEARQASKAAKASGKPEDHRRAAEKHHQAAHMFGVDANKDVEAKASQEHHKNMAAAELQRAAAAQGSGKKSRGDGMSVRFDGELDAAQRSALEDSSFAVPARKALPIENPEHLRAAMARFGQTQFASDDERKTAASRIVARAKKLGVDSSGFEERWVNRSDAAQRRGVTMDAEEQIRSLKAQLIEIEKKAKEHGDALAAQTERADKAEARAKTLEDTVSDLNVKIAAGADAMETKAVKEQAERADKAEEAVRQFDQRFDQAVQKRTSIMLRGARVMGFDFRMDGMTDREIQAVVVKKLDAKADVSAAVTDAYIAGRFDSLVELHDKSARSLTRAGEVIIDARQDGRGVESRADAREERAEAWRNQWKQGLPSSREGARPNRKEA